MIDITITELFFIITGIAVIIITVLISIGVIYLILFLRTVKQIAKTAHRAAEIASEDINDLRNNIKSKGFSLSALAGFVKAISKRKIINKAKKK